MQCTVGGMHMTIQRTVHTICILHKQCTTGSVYTTVDGVGGGLCNAVCTGV